jgi:Uma2 family endonuclease
MSKSVVIDFSKQYSVVDYLSWEDDIRRELIDGAVKLMAGVNRFHSRVTSRLVKIYETIFETNDADYFLFQAPFDVFLSDDNIVQPDFGIVCDLSKVADNGINGTPDFLVEILSPTSLKRDVHEKFVLYERFGVREYWIINPRERYINVFTLQSDGKYDDGTHYDINQDAEIQLSIIEGLTIKLSDIFKE